MTKFGKVLVYLNLSLAVMFAAWGLAIYGNRVDWGKTPEKAPAAKGKLLEREDQFKEATSQYQSAMSRYNKALSELQATEKKRPEDQKYYRDELAKLETGLDAKGQLVAAPVTEIVYDKGQVRLDANGHPALKQVEWQRPQQPLLDVVRLNKEFDATHEEMKKQKVVLDDLLNQEKELTEKLNGDGKARKGLRRLMDEVQEAMVMSLGEKEFLRRMEKSGVNVTVSASRGLEGEQEYLMPLLYNRRAELNSVLRRQQRLEARVEELKNTAATTRQR